MLAKNHDEFANRDQALSKTACWMTGQMRARMRDVSLILVTAIYLALAAGPAMAENAALKVANTALKGGKFSFVVKTIDKALKSGSLDTKDMSRALLYRGLAFQSLNKSAQSIADLTNAIWMGGLTQSEKAEALKYRARAFDAGGVSARAKTDKADAARLASGLPTSESLVGTPAKPIRTASKPKGGFGSGLTNGISGISDFFGNIVPGSSSAKKPAPAAPKPATPKIVPVAKPVIPAAPTVPAVPAVPTVIASAPAAIAASKAAAKAATNVVQSAPSPTISSPSVSIPSVATPSASGTRSAASIAASNARSAARAEAARRRGQLKATPKTSGWATAVNQVPAASAPAKQTSPSGGSGLGGVTDFFGNLFGGGSKAKPAPVQATSPAASPAASPVASHQPTRTAALDVKKAAPAARAPQPRSQAQGRYKLQIATVRSKDEANTIMAGLQSSYSSLVAKHPARIDEAVVGNMGTFYRVRLEAFDSKKTALKTCNKLRAGGLDCFPVAR